MSCLSKLSLIPKTYSQGPEIGMPNTSMEVSFEGASMFIVQLAAVSCAATHVPESKMATRASDTQDSVGRAKVEVLLRRTFISVGEAAVGVTQRLERPLSRSPSYKPF